MPSTHRNERLAVAELSEQLAALDCMKLGELAEKYRELYGEPTRSFNTKYLRKRLAFRIQELAHGGLPPRALDCIRRLGDGMPERWRMRVLAQGSVVAPLPPPSAAPVPPPSSMAAAEAEPPPQSKVLPVPVGTVLRRVWKRQTYEVVVHAGDFELEGKRYPSLFSIAKHITGTHWNARVFFGLNKPNSSEASR